MIRHPNAVWVRYPGRLATQNTARRHGPGVRLACLLAGDATLVPTLLLSLLQLVVADYFYLPPDGGSGFEVVKEGRAGPVLRFLPGRARLATLLSPDLPLP
ncbi:hypothetical protein BU16DRAFT_243350 [Lophium mytilinum]|uniref:Uncharacterized protein n=1 Tax=Lophium mytilinum TaxID=390894 RepID=A0A6A6R769_9PEZI|nr:hypothetical protein BU16DRAFT_243350 [Lophium mytilinum]